MELEEYLLDQHVTFEKDVLLSTRSWIKTGGKCSYWIIPNTIEELTGVCCHLYENSIPFDIVGQTSNIFFHSTYHPQVVISTIKLNHYEQKGDIVACECGVSVVKLAKDMLMQGYAGFYGLVGLPGTVGSAIVNNASCFDCSLSSMLLSAEVLMNDGTIQTVEHCDFNYTHRSSVFKKGEIVGIILSLRLKIKKATNIEKEKQKSEDSVSYRREKQERQAGKTLGSIFAARVMRKNLRNKVIKAAMRLLPSLLRKEPRYIQKKAILFLYGYRDLDAYCSDRQINTFIWKDEQAEAAFERYKEMMNKVYKDLQIEIEEKF
jgi:UDP-N-acetylenolpyruvoylglucosamine reductase